MKLKNKLLLGGLTAVFLAVMSFSAWKIWVIRSEYHTGEAAYEDISHMILLPQKAAEPQPPVINKPAGAETLPDEDDTIWPEVDFAALREINPDIVAWIYIEGTKINYPIVQGGDNSYYLKHLFSGEWNGSGCIFLDFRNDASFADRHSIIYGHHIKNGKNQKLPVFNFQIHTTASSYSCPYHIIFFHNYPQEHEFHVFSNVQACL